MKFVRLATAAATLAWASTAGAVVVNWADLTQSNGSTFANGNIALNASTNVSVSVTGTGFSFVQTNGGINYWTQGTPAPYTSGTVSNAPTGTDIIAFNQGGRKTITFSQAVSDVYLALISWQGNAGTFDQPFEVISQGCGYWGCGTFANVTPTSFTGNGELHGIIRFTGNFTSATFTDLTEDWHGIQIGIAGLATPSGVPEPMTWAMMIAGFGMIGGAMRRRAGTLATA